MNIPENLKYTKDHDWINIDGDIAQRNGYSIKSDKLAELTANDLKRIEVRSGDTVLVQGVGGLGLYAVAMAREAGAQPDECQPEHRGHDEVEPAGQSDQCK